MFLLHQLLQAARTRLGRRNSPKNARRSTIAVEQLDHRRLLSVNFTGNVATDFPATTSPGVVVFNQANTPNITHPVIPPSLQPLIKTSGFDLSEIRVSYDSADDTLSVGFNQPPSGNPGQPGSVIAGDADDNGNAGTVNPAVFLVSPGFFEPAAMGGTDQMAAFLDFNGSRVPQIVAGYPRNGPAPTPTDPNPQKPYEVATAVPNISNPMGIPSFGTTLPQFTGNVYLNNSADHPNLEFSITHFSELYAQETGKPLTSTSVIGIGGFAGSQTDGGISDAFFPDSFFTLSQATLPTATCPPVSPTIAINPHEHRIVDSLHRDLVRVTVFGTSGFNVQNINPSSVELDGVHAIAHVVRKTRRDQFPMATYVFVANQLHLQPGLNNVTLTGSMKNSTTTFQTTSAVLNVPNAGRATGRLRGYMGNFGSLYPRLSRIEKKHPSTVIAPANGAPAVSVSPNPKAKGLAQIRVNYTPVSSAGARDSAAAAARRTHTPAARPVVSITRRDAGHAAHEPKLPTKLRHSMHDFLGGHAAHARSGR